MSRDRAGPLLGIDVGAVRIGVAVCDADGRVAVPLTTLTRGGGGPDRALDAIVALARQRGVAGLMVGLPLSLSGQEGPSAAASRRFATDLAARVAPTPVRLVDERLTTASASRGLRSAGLSSREARHVVDQVAAAAILQGALDHERSGGPAGELVAASSQAAPSDAPDETRNG